MIFKNASVVFPDGVRKADIRTEGGIIAEIAPRIAGKDAIDLEGLTVFPGFIDMHVHLREPGFEKKEDIESGCRAAVKGGDKTSPQERELFVQKLLSMPDIRYCPHGRPVMVKISRYELEKQFGRVQ